MEILILGQFLRISPTKRKKKRNHVFLVFTNKFQIDFIAKKRVDLNQFQTAFTEKQNPNGNWNDIF